VNGNGAAVISREIGALLSATGLCTGVACAEGTFVNGEQTRRAGNTSRHAADVLMHPLLEAAVVEVADEAIVTGGLGFEQCHVVIFTGSGPEGLTPAKRVLVESVAEGGTLILNAALPWADELAGHCRGEVVLFGTDVQKSAQKWQKTVVFASKNAVFATTGGREERIADLDPALSQDEIDQRLAVSAAGWILRRLTKPPAHP
jgi:cyanophycin synthetase